MNVAVIFGGRSCESDISIITGVMAVNAAKEKHTVIPVYIDGQGVWYTGKNLDTVAAFTDKKCKKRQVHLRPSSNGLYTKRGRRMASIDAAIICCHGKFGEDGCLSGLLEISGIPYVGSGVLGSAVGMDKIMQKLVFRAEGIETTPFVGVDKSELSGDFYSVTSRINSLTFPLIVKPATLGSSIGIGRAEDFKQLFVRLAEAFEWDSRVIIENALTDFTEVNCAVLGSGDKLIVSQIEQPLSSGFLSFKDKYEREEYSEDKCGSSGISGGSKGDSGRYLPAHITPEMAGRVRSAAKQVFKLLCCSGVARIDFLIKDDKLYVNEINTVPGSLSSYLFAFDGLDFSLLIDKLLFTAFEKKDSISRLRYTFDSNVLKTKSGAKIN